MLPTYPLFSLVFFFLYPVPCSTQIQTWTFLVISIFCHTIIFYSCHSTMASVYIANYKKLIWHLLLLLPFFSSIYLILRKNKKKYTQNQDEEALLCKYINVCVIEFMRFQTFTFMIFFFIIVVVAWVCSCWCCWLAYSGYSYILAFNMVQCHFENIFHLYNRHLENISVIFLDHLLPIDSNYDTAQNDMIEIITILYIDDMITIVKKIEWSSIFSLTNSKSIE